MEPEIGQTYYPFVLNLIRGNSLEVQEHDIEEPGMMVPGSYSIQSRGNGSGATERANMIAVINLNHVVFKYNQECGPVGTETISRWVQNYDSNPNVAGIILNIDSPGGEARAINNLTDAIKACGKPVIAHVASGIAASAAYAIAAVCDEIYVSHTTDAVGSIGTYITLADFKAYYKEQGLPIHEIYATKSTEKNLEVREAFKGNYKKMKAEIDVVNEAFISLVKSARPGANEEVFSGGMYFADEALKMGLIDGIQSFKDTADRVWELALGYEEEEGAEETSAEATQSIQLSDMKFEATLAVLAATAANGETSEEQLTAANNEISAALEAAGGELITQDELNAARAEVPSETQQELETLQSRVQELEDEADPSGSATTTTGKPAEGQEAQEADENAHLTEEELALINKTNHLSPA
jgi:protease-4